MRLRLTYANVMSTIAVCLVLCGGAAYAASQVGRNTVGRKQLKKSAVTTAKLKNEAVTAAKVRKGTLTGAQINVSTLGEVPAASKAADAATLGGLASGHFAQSSRFLFGHGRTNATPAITLFTAPGDFVLRTTDEGSLLPHLEVENLSPGTWEFIKKKDTSVWMTQEVKEGQSAQIDFSDAEAGTLHAVDKDQPGKQAVIECTYVGVEMFCSAILSPAM
jgi:hypothetical protein